MRPSISLFFFFLFFFFFFFFFSFCTTLLTRKGIDGNARHRFISFSPRPSSYIIGSDGLVQIRSLLASPHCIFRGAHPPRTNAAGLASCLCAAQQEACRRRRAHVRYGRYLG